MQLTYDPSVDALTIQLAPGKRSARTEELHAGILVDFDAAGHPITFEILDAGRIYSRAMLQDLPLPSAMLPLTRAAEKAGLDPATLRQQIRRQRLPATKWHREWWVDEEALAAYLRSRAPQGRRGKRAALVKA